MAHTTYLLRRETIERLLDDMALTQEALASEIGLSRVHLNRLINRRRPLTRRSRRKLLDCTLLQGVQREDLWDVSGSK